MQQEESIKETINPVLFSKVEDIWNLFDTQTPKFVIHICSNLHKPFEKGEKNNCISLLIVRF